MTELAVLTAAETDVLADCEETISHGLQTFVEVGTALSLIRDNRLYRATHQTFESYCMQRWGFTDGRARQLIIASRVATNVTADGLPAPANEGQARELARVPEPERAEVWRAANEATAGKPTAAAIRAAAQPAETAVGADISPTDASGEGAALSVPVVAAAASPESEGKSDSGEVTPDPEADASAEEWCRRFHERAEGVREGRESYASFAADFTLDDIALAGGPAEYEVLKDLVDNPPAHDPAAFAATLDRLVPDDNPHREWQARFLDAISSTYRITRFTPEDVAERADEELVGELIRVINLLDDYRLRVVNARILSRPDNVTPIRRAQ